MAVDPALRRFYAEEVRAAAALPEGRETARVLDAFAAVPREDHSGPGPWLLRSARLDLPSRRTPDADPAWLYHNVLIALDEDQGINIGEPALWARFFQHFAAPLGARVLQVGTGTGYFTAILAELVGPGGHVMATEVEEDLADRAAEALQNRPNVSVRQGNGALDVTPDDGPFDLIVAFAGVTHPAAAWHAALAPGGRMALPVTGSDWWGAMVLFSPTSDGIEGTTLGKCGFYPCAGARDARMERHLDAFWSDPARLDGTKIRLGAGDSAIYEALT